MPKSRVRKTTRKQVAPTGLPKPRLSIQEEARRSVAPTVDFLSRLDVEASMDTSLAASALAVDLAMAAACREDATAGELTAIEQDIPARLDSLLARWSKPESVLPLLALGHEEAWHYEPVGTSLLARTLVVVGVRDSAVESAHTARHFTDPDVVRLTSITALRLNDGLPELGNPVPPAPAGPGRWTPPTDDPFEGLDERYPAAWQAFSQLAALLPWVQDQTDRGPFEAKFEPIRPESVHLDSLRVGGVRVLSGRNAGNIILDGMASGVGDNLIRLIDEGGEANIATPSIKHLSRNPQVVLAVVEALLGRDGSFSTANIHIGSGLVAARGVPVFPHHHALTDPAVLRGIGGSHRTVIKSLGTMRRV